MKMIKSLQVLLTTGALAIALLLGANTVQAATVILDGDNVIRIENLSVTDQSEEVTDYNVDFLFDTAAGVYGVGFDFDFTQEEDGLLARGAVMDALNDNIPTPGGAGPDGTDDFFIALEIDDTGPAPVIAALGGEVMFGQWDPCDTGCAPGGAAILQLDDNFTYAKFTPTVIPVPAAVWLFGSALGMLGWHRRRTA